MDPSDSCLLDEAVFSNVQSNRKLSYCFETTPDSTWRAVNVAFTLTKKSLAMISTIYHSAGGLLAYHFSSK
jgi:hypothetical protein